MFLFLESSQHICLFDNGLQMKICLPEQINTIISELVFNTGMTGYQEIFTDSSYLGQSVVMTYPLIGNYGLNEAIVQSNAPKISCLIAKEIDDCIKFHLWKYKIAVITDIDTRYLVQNIRDGKIKKLGIFPENDFNLEESLETLNNFEIDTKQIISSNCIQENDVFINNNRKNTILLVDCGVKRGIIDNLSRFYNIAIVRFDVSLTEYIKKYNVNKILISNGPGNPEDLKNLIEQISSLLGKIVVYGICLGHQIVCLATGCSVEKMTFGHRGSNHPVIDIQTNKVFLVSQNHSYSVIKESLPKNIKPKYINLNDGTIEGIISDELMIKTTQFHPESSPGTNDANFIFQEWFGNDL